MLVSEKEMLKNPVMAYKKIGKSIHEGLHSLNLLNVTRVLKIRTMKCRSRSNTGEIRNLYGILVWKY
jgi:hypothetical protein